YVGAPDVNGFSESARSDNSDEAVVVSSSAGSGPRAGTHGGIDCAKNSIGAVGVFGSTDSAVPIKISARSWRHKSSSGYRAVAVTFDQHGVVCFSTSSSEKADSQHEDGN